MGEHKNAGGITNGSRLNHGKIKLSAEFPEAGAKPRDILLLLWALEECRNQPQIARNLAGGQGHRPGRFRNVIAVVACPPKIFLRCEARLNNTNPPHPLRGEDLPDSHANRSYVYA